MRRFLLLFLSFFVSLSMFAQGTGNLKFTKKEHAFGKVPQSTPVTYSFEFENTGTSPVIIEDAVAECGCTKPEFPKKPITKGKKGVISVTYDAKEAGAFTKKVTVTVVNSKDPVVLTITGEVVKAK